MPQGRLDLDILWDGEHITDVRLANLRPVTFRLLMGRSPQEALALVPRLFTLCRHGQTAAAWQALAAAERREVDNTPRADIALAAEAAQEHLWRLLLDWPALLGLMPARTAFVAWHQRLAEIAVRGDWGEAGGAFAEFVGREILGMAPAEWLAMDEPWRASGALAHVVNELKHVNIMSGGIELLPEGLAAAEYYREIHADLDPNFARQPVWRGRPAETGPLARWRGIPPVAAALAGGWARIAARVLARGVDLAVCVLEAEGTWQPRRRSDGFSPAPGVGFAWVETARGLLLHRVRLVEGRIADYLIVAPTEWNFHPAGAFRAELLGWRVADADAVERRARLLALALDPCVSYNVQVRSMADKRAAKSVNPNDPP